MVHLLITKQPQRPLRTPDECLPKANDHFEERVCHSETLEQVIFSQPNNDSEISKQESLKIKQEGKENEHKKMQRQKKKKKKKKKEI